MSKKKDEYKGSFRDVMNYALMNHPKETLKKFGSKVNKKERSKNARAGDLCGTRSEYNVYLGHPSKNICIINEPYELGYRCPICGAGWRKRIWTKKGDFMSAKILTLHWSEYAGFLWCEKCNIDIPSSLCLTNEILPRQVLENRINLFLDFIEYIRNRGGKLP